MYENGLGVAADYKEAYRWYTLAAEQGVADAQLNIGVMCYMGYGVPKNNEFTYAWLSLAAAKGNQTAKNNLKIVEVEMNPNQIGMAQQLAMQISTKARN